MIKFLTDEDFDNRILRGLFSRQPDLDIIRLQDTHLAGADDETILEWAFQERRILLTHDVSTMTKYVLSLQSGEETRFLIQKGPCPAQKPFY